MLAVTGDDDTAWQRGVALALEFLQPRPHGGVTCRATHGVAGVLQVVALYQRMRVGGKHDVALGVETQGPAEAAEVREW